jgi:hypothetical protein
MQLKGHVPTYKISDFHLKVDETGTLLGCPIFKGHEFQYGCPQTSVRNYHHILRNTPERGKPHVPTFKIILLPPSSSLMKFQHTSTRLPGFTSQKTANIKIQFISSDRKISKFMAGLEILQHSDETKPL